MIRELQLEGCRFTEKVGCKIVRAVRYVINTLQSLNLANNQLKEEFGKELSRTLQTQRQSGLEISHSKITYVNVGSNNIGDTVVARLLRVLRKNEYIVEQQIHI